MSRAEITEHAGYVRDRVKLRAYERALSQLVGPTSSVLDLGAGTGILGLLAARAGARVVYAVDRGSVELYASQAETRIVVISATLGDPRKLIEAAAKAGGLATWIVTAEARSVARLASSLAGLERVVVTSTAGSPEDILFLANEIVFGTKSD